MAADVGYKEHVMEMLTPLDGVSARAMFGGYGIFHEGTMFALISGSTLYFKVDDATRDSYEEAGGEQFQRMPYFQVPVDVLEEESALREWAQAAIVVGHATASKKRSRKRGS